MHVYPLVERIMMLENTIYNTLFISMDFKNEFRIIYDYVHRFRNHPVMKEAVIDEH